MNSNHLTLLPVIGLTLFVAATSLEGAATFVETTDDFSVAGSLTGTTADAGGATWANINGTSGSIIVSSGAVALPGSGTGEATQLNFTTGTSDLTSGLIYAGFTFTVGSSGSITTGNTIQSIAGFRSGTAASGSNALGFGVFRPSGAAITFNSTTLADTSTSQIDVGIFGGVSQNASTSTLTSWSAALDRGTAYRAVIGYDMDNNSATLWINPTSISATSVTLTGISADVRGWFLRQGNSSTGDITLDDLVISQTFVTAAALTEATSVVPELSTHALLGGLAALGMVACRRKLRGKTPPAPKPRFLR